MNFLTVFDTHCFSFSFCIFVASDLLKMMIYSEFCKIKAETSLSLKCSAFFNTITLMFSKVNAKIRVQTSHGAFSKYFLPLFLQEISSNLLLVVGHN